MPHGFQAGQVLPVIVDDAVSSLLSDLEPRVQMADTELLGNCGISMHDGAVSGLVEPYRIDCLAALQAHRERRRDAAVAQSGPSTTPTLLSARPALCPDEGTAENSIISGLGPEREPAASCIQSTDRLLPSPEGSAPPCIPRFPGSSAVPPDLSSQQGYPPDMQLFPPDLNKKVVLSEDARERERERERERVLDSAKTDRGTGRLPG